MMPVHKELCVAVRKYQDKNGAEKTEWLNIGRIIEKNDGGKFMALKPWINLAAIPRQGDDVMVAMFDPKDSDNKPKNNGNDYAKASASDSLDDDIPF